MTGELKSLDGSYCEVVANIQRFNRYDHADGRFRMFEVLQFMVSPRLIDYFTGAGVNSFTLVADDGKTYRLQFLMGSESSLGSDVGSQFVIAD